VTCIVAISDGKNVCMGGDSASVDEDSSLVSSRKEPKIFIKNGYLLGYAGSFRFGKVLQHTFNPPKLSDDNIDKFLNTTFVNALRECCELNKVDPGSEEDSSEMLVGVAGRVFEFCNDWHFGEDINNFNAIGSGTKFALGSLYSTRRLRSHNVRIQLALESAERFSTSVRGPFTILEL
jgi:ATP-dependent protease HslVU (ClpYQ) peptidase subunit